jgi:gamma-glutamyltranspeptidase/glutathione hydrolase
MFSATPSSGWLLGGAFVAGATGVPMSNRMQAFRLEPSSPNVLAGGKRPRTTLTPTIVLKDGKPFLAIGTPGGDSQDQQILLVLLNMMDFGMDLQAAIEAPRVKGVARAGDVHLGGGVDQPLRGRRRVVHPHLDRAVHAVL